VTPAQLGDGGEVAVIEIEAGVVFAIAHGAALPDRVAVSARTAPLEPLGDATHANQPGTEHQQ
jgi:hypothetical protein